jgi:hypothetical protein
MSRRIKGQGHMSINPDVGKKIKLFVYSPKEQSTKTTN